MGSKTIIALTGGIGSGKSEVVRIFKTLGVPSVDADQIARNLRSPEGEAYPLLMHEFGDLRPQYLRNLLSQDPSSKDRLEKIMHPLIQKHSKIAFERTFQNHPQAPFLIYEAALLIEAKRAQDFDGLIVVTAPTELRTQRVAKRDQCSLDAAQAMVQAQITDEERLKYAHWVIHNHGEKQNLELQVHEVFEKIKLAKLKSS